MGKRSKRPTPDVFTQLGLGNELRDRMIVLRGKLVAWQTQSDQAEALAVTLKRSTSEMAALVLGTFTDYRTIRGEASSMIEYVRLLYPEVPAEKDGYKNDPNYKRIQRLLSIGRLEAARTAAGLKPRSKVVGVAVPASVVRRLIATCEAVADSPKEFWAVFAEALGDKWTRDRINRLKTSLEGVEPLPIAGIATEADEEATA